MSEAAETLGAVKEETVIFSNQNGHSELQQEENQPTWYISSGEIKSMP